MTPEQVLDRVASRAHGIVTLEEARDAGLTPGEVRHRVEVGSLIREHRGTFRVGHRAPDHRARYMAAVKACGRRSALDGFAGCHLLALIDREPEIVEVVAPSTRRVPGLRVRESRNREIRSRIVDGIPVVYPARALLSVASRLDQEQLAAACHVAQVRYRVTPAAVDVELGGLRGPAGTRRLQRLLFGDDPLVLSRMEKEFVRLLRGNHLPLPNLNRLVASRRTDCHWPDYRLIVELDSYQFHNSRQSWRRDRRREAEARARGEELLRFIWEDIFVDRSEMMRELRGRLRRPPPGRVPA